MTQVQVFESVKSIDIAPSRIHERYSTVTLHFVDEEMAPKILRLIYKMSFTNIGSGVNI